MIMIFIFIKFLLLFNLKESWGTGNLKKEMWNL